MVLHQLFIGAKFTISLEQTFFTRRVDGENKSKCCIKKSTYSKTFDFDLLLIQPLCLCSLCMILQILQTCCTDQCDAFIVPSVLSLKNCTHELSYSLVDWQWPKFNVTTFFGCIIFRCASIFNSEHSVKELELYLLLRQSIAMLADKVSTLSCLTVVWVSMWASMSCFWGFFVMINILFLDTSDVVGGPVGTNWRHWEGTRRRRIREEEEEEEEKEEERSLRIRRRRRCTCLTSLNKVIVPCYILAFY